MKMIPLTQGKVALVDDEDFERLNRFKWFAHKRHGIFYAGRQVTVIYIPETKYFKQRMVHMHQVLLVPPEGLMCDHIDGDGLNNQKSNLRIVTNRQNMQNIHKVNKTSRFPGISKNYNQWQSDIYVNGKRQHLGLFPTEEEAAVAYRNAVAGIGEAVI